MEDQWEELEWKVIFACLGCGFAQEFFCIDPKVKYYPLGCSEDDKPLRSRSCCPECGRLISKTDYYFQPASAPFENPLISQAGDYSVDDLNYWEG